MENLYRCLNPSSIAVVGGREVERVIEQCRKMGFAGEIWPVNPKREQLGGITCYQTVNQLPKAPDVAFVAIPAAPSVDCIAALSAMGAGGVVCYASGFREVGDTELHQRLVEAAGEMPVIGPNCYGFINAMCGAALWPDQHGLGQCDSGVAIFSSSGNVSVNMTMQQRELSIALIVTVGNQAMVGIEHCIDAVLDDPRISAIGIHVEGLNNLPLFIELARRAAIARKPVIALKTGRSNIGARITMSHTATIAGQSGLYDHLFRRLGVGQVDDTETFLEALKLVSIVGPLGGNRVASMSCSGGEASLIADLTEHSTLTFPSLEKHHKQLVRNTLNEFVSVDNPLDYHTFIWGDGRRQEATFTAMLKGEFDLTLLILDYPCVNQCDMSDWIVAGEAFAIACESTNQKGAVVCSMAENMPREVRQELIKSGVVPILGIRSALGAIEAASQACQLDMPLPKVRLVVDSDLTIKGKSLPEHQSKAMLEESGLPVAQGYTATTIDEALSYASKIGFPVVLKASGVEIAHKSEIGGVVLNIQTPEHVKTAFRQLNNLAQDVLVEEMIPPGVAEILLGISYDSQFGHYLVIGFGGTIVELVSDRALLLLPASKSQVLEAVADLKVNQLLKGFRGKPEGDIGAMVKCIEQLIVFVDQHYENLLEADINPLIVEPVGQGVKVADALLVFRHSEMVD